MVTPKKALKKNQTAGMLLSLLALLLPFAFLTIFALASFRSWERTHAATSYERCIGLLEYYISRLGATAADYAQWDDMRAFIEKRNPDFAQKTVPEGILENLQADFALVYDDSGKRLFSRVVQGAQQPLPEQLVDVPLSGTSLPSASAQLSRNASLFAPGGYTGLLTADNRIFVIASRHISNTDGSEKCCAIFVLGKEINSTMLGVLEKLTSVAPSFSVASAPTQRNITMTSEAITIKAALPAIGSYTVVTGKISRPWTSMIVYGVLHTSFFSFCAILFMILRLAYNRKKTALLAARGKELELRLEQEADELLLFSAIMQNTSEGIVVTDIEGTILNCNPSFEQITGYSRSEIQGTNIRLLRAGVHEDSFYDSMNQLIAESGRWEGEVSNRRKDGALYPAWLIVDTIGTSRRIGYIVDITKLKLAEEKVNRLAFFDTLTGLPNRSLFNDRLEHAIARSERGKTRLALIMFDLDRFKDINEGYGHSFGDKLLTALADRMRDVLRAHDTVCRLGGDEFAVIIEAIDSSSDAETVAKKIIQALGKPFRIGDVQLYVNTSIGIAMFPFDGTTREDLVKAADAAMYEAKHNGRNQYRFASGDIGNSSRKRIEAENLLRRALTDGLLEVYYQPQVSLGSIVAGGQVSLAGAEALIRIREGDMVHPPSAFIEAAEESGLVVPMGGWILEQACRDARSWTEAGYPLKVSVNVSQRQFENDTILEQTEKALEVSKLNPGQLTLEITESLFMKDTKRIQKSMNKLKSRGVQFAIDDFGTGYSSLKAIDKLPLDYVKIDKSFVDTMHLKTRHGSVALAVVSLSSSMGAVSIAEGVENYAQVEILRSRGCDLVQGYYISKPMDARTFSRYIGDIRSFRPERDEEAEDVDFLDD